MNSHRSGHWLYLRCNDGQNRARDANRDIRPVVFCIRRVGSDKQKRTDMTSRFMSRASAAFLFFVAAAAIGQAQAQNYDGDGRLRFGAFVQGSELDFDVERLGAPLGTASIDGFGGGASFGYDWVLRDRLVFGLEADASVEDSSERLQRRSFASDYLVTLRGRIGAHLQPGWLVYATGGAAFLGVEFQGVPTVVSRTKESETLTGWTIGGGTELDLDRVTLFAEYLFAEFDTFKFTDPLESAVPNPPLGSKIVPTRYSADVEEQLFRVGVKFKIGHDFYDDGARKGLK
jgi:opacity protein-like surface antigen